MRISFAEWMIKIDIVMSVKKSKRERQRAAFENWNKLATTHIITHLTNHKIFQHNLIIQCFVCSPNKKLQHSHLRHHHHRHPCEISISLYICLSLHVIAHSLTLSPFRSISFQVRVYCVLCVPVCLSLTETFHVGFHRKATPACPGFTIHIEFGLNYSD